MCIRDRDRRRPAPTSRNLPSSIWVYGNSSDSARVSAHLCANPVLYHEADDTSVPMAASTLDAVKGCGFDGQARTRELKAACLCTQASPD